ncbi:MAG: hypothetical protein JXA77_11160 [Bacteroidales bacterium]|nr:hypothetical protein [Bacteroidales bacterium]MBN2819051.1 hypothetical protein [Bacteroidales bacterium]
MKIFRFLLIAGLVFWSCKGGESSDSKTDDSQSKKTKAVSLYDGVPVRALPVKDGKYLTSLNLGETMLYLGETRADSTDSKNEFYKVELSDGSVAWARTYGVIIDAEPAAIVGETPVYKRPDLVNKTNESFYKLEFVAVIANKGEWIEVVGSNRKKSGWIQSQYISTAKNDVAVATLATKAILNSNGEIQIEKVPDFLADLPYDEYIFKTYLQNIADEQVEQAVVNAIEEYEDEYYEEEAAEE